MSLKRGNQSFSLKCVCLSFVVLGRVVECCQKWGGGRCFTQSRFRWRRTRITSWWHCEHSDLISDRLQSTRLPREKNVQNWRKRQWQKLPFCQREKESSPPQALNQMANTLADFSKKSYRTRPLITFVGRKLYRWQIGKGGKRQWT